MAQEKIEKPRKKWIIKLKDKYRLVILNDETLEEKISLRLSRLNVFIVLGSLSIFLVFVTTYIIAFTPLREYIPGYASVTSQKAIYELQTKADSLENAMKEKDLFVENIKNVIAGRAMVDELPAVKDTSINYRNVTFKNSRDDSMLRVEMERQDKFELSANDQTDASPPRSNISNYLFFTPLKGLVTNNFDPANRHYGIDIVSKKNEAVKATLEGRVIFADWTLETGYTIGIQHQENLVSVYKHNSTMLIKIGSYVKAGEPIAIIGESGELSSGPHLHFELWYNGNPINPKDYMSF
ncbi:MAG: M23 family metallopeptidase [Bacteroidetes bacterium]|nr:M23 family metallopeptidase [Bacteroidota bacterium]